VLPFLGLVVAGAAACGVTETNRDALPEEELRNAAVQAVCQAIEPCCEAAGWPYDEKRCVESRLLNVVPVLVVDSPHVAYDEVEAKACVKTLRAAAASCGAESPGMEACGKLYRGTLAVGDECSHSAECEGEKLVCPWTRGAARRCSELRPPIVGALGDPCSRTCDENEPAHCEGVSDAPDLATCYRNRGVYCDQVTLACETIAEDGDACSEGGCRTGSLCDQGVCSPRRSEGPCAGNPRVCTADSYCDAVLNECFLLRALGEQCANDQQCATSLCQRGACAYYQFATEQTCAG
jgi:hypothetical protein